MYGSSKISICNRALHLIGNGRGINSLDEATAEARICSKFYDTALASLLAAHNWMFALCEGECTEIASNTGFFFAYPNRCIKVRGVFDLAHKPIHFIVSMNKEGARIIRTKEQPFFYNYTVFTDEPSAYPALFEEALCWLLARHIAWGIGGIEAGVRDDVSKHYLIALEDAKVSDANESGSVRMNFESDYVSVR